MVYYSVVIKLRIFFLCALCLLFSTPTFAGTKAFCDIYKQFPSGLSHHGYKEYCPKDNLSCSPYEGNLSRNDKPQIQKVLLDTSDDRTLVQRNSKAKAVVTIYCKSATFKKINGVCRKIEGKFRPGGTGTLVEPNNPCHQRDFELIHSVAHVALNDDGSPKQCYIKTGALGGGTKFIWLEPQHVGGPLWRKNYVDKDCNTKGDRVTSAKAAEDFVIFKATRRLTGCPQGEDCGNATKHLKLLSHRTLSMHATNTEDYKLLKSGQHPSGAKWEYLATAGLKNMSSKIEPGKTLYPIQGVASKKGTMFGGYDPDSEIKGFWKNEQGEDRIAITGCDGARGHSGGPLAIGYSLKGKEGVIAIGVASYERKTKSGAFLGMKLYTPHDIKMTQFISDRECKDKNTQIASRQTSKGTQDN